MRRAGEAEEARGAYRLLLMTGQLRSRTAILSARAKVPEGVVLRSFASETVVLNLKSGKYHGLNPVGGRMLEVLTNSSSIEHAVRELANEYDRPIVEIEGDVCEFCFQLQTRGLVELTEG